MHRSLILFLLFSIILVSCWPENPDEVVVGVTGHLYSPNNERGMHKTVDGGKTWRKTLFINEKIQMHAASTMKTRNRGSLSISAP